jgi:intracellular sulfur oxidation DsrE/DsrF family protein
VSVEIVANSGGLDLLREGVSAHAGRIAGLRAAYPGLSLVACGQTARRLRESGTAVHLLPGTIMASSALDQIVLRMQQGWAYVRI